MKRSQCGCLLIFKMMEVEPAVLSLVVLGSIVGKMTHY